MSEKEENIIVMKNTSEVVDVSRSVCFDIDAQSDSEYYTATMSCCYRTKWNEYIFIGSSEGDLVVYNRTKERQERTLKFCTHCLFCMWIHRKNGREFVIVGSWERIYVLEITSNHPNATLRLERVSRFQKQTFPSRYVYDGKSLDENTFCAGSQTVLSFYDFETGAVVYEFNDPNSSGIGYIGVVILLQRRANIAVIGCDMDDAKHLIHFYDVRKQKYLQSLKSTDSAFANCGDGRGRNVDMLESIVRTAHGQESECLFANFGEFIVMMDVTDLNDINQLFRVNSVGEDSFSVCRLGTFVSKDFLFVMTRGEVGDEEKEREEGDGENGTDYKVFVYSTKTFQLHECVHFEVQRGRKGKKNNLSPVAMFEAESQSETKEFFTVFGDFVCIKWKFSVPLMNIGKQVEEDEKERVEYLLADVDKSNDDSILLEKVTFKLGFQSFEFCRVFLLL